MQQGTGQALASTLLLPWEQPPWKAECLLAFPSTMHPLPLVVFLTLAAGPARTIPEGCREDYSTCREDCTIDYGGSTTKYRQLTQCIQRCEKEQKECTDQHYTLRDAQIELRPPRQADPAMKEPEEYEQPREDTAREPPRDAVRRGVYRAADESPAPRVEPAVTTEPKARPEQPRPAPEPTTQEGEGISTVDEPEPEPTPAPKPAPKPAEPLRPTPPPEPKKKDISDWDPNGD